MKKISIYFLLACLPFYLLAQDDYCPCMDKQNEVDEWGQFILELEEKEKTSPQLIFIPEQKTGQDRKSLPLTIDKSEKDIEDKESPTIAEIPTISNIKKSAMKKHKKRYKLRLKSRTKVKKYRGQCPMF